MTPLNDALIRVSRLLTKNQIPYMVIGGMANIVWGNPRATIDIDVTIWVDDNAIEQTVELFKTTFIVMVDAPVEFIKKTRVLPVKTQNDTSIDIIFGALPFELDAIKRVVEIEIGGAPVNFCSPEDLILHKIISKREKDIEDVRGILRVTGNKLDLHYLEPRIEELSTILERPAILTKWKKWKKDSL